MSQYDGVSFSLIDFESPQNSSPDNILMDYLKTSFRKPLYKPFSCKFNKCEEILDKNTLNSLSGYCIEISYRYNCLLVFVESKIFILSRISKTLIRTLNIGESIAIVLDENNDVIYILGGIGNQCAVRKYDLGLFINGNGSSNGLIWEQNLLLTNAYGIAKLQKYLLVLDSNSLNLVILDPKSGETINDFTFTLNTRAHSIYMRSMIGKSELVVGTNNSNIEIYQIVERQNSHLKLDRKVELQGFFYSFTFCHANNYIITDSENESITVLNGDTLQVVKTYLEDNAGSIFGVCLDKFSGELFVCYENGLFVYQ